MRTLVRFVVVAMLGWAVYCVAFGAAFFVAGGFLLLAWNKYRLFAAVVGAAALAPGIFTAAIDASPGGFPPPIDRST